MMEIFDKSILKRKIERLPNDRRLAFILLLCERMSPALKQFAADTAFDDSLYRACLSSAWRFLERSTRPLPNYREMSKQCVDRAPDTEDFSHPLTSAALNAALSVAAMMDFLDRDNIHRILEATALACDTAASYAQMVESGPPQSLSVEQIIRHPLVQQEIVQQAKDLELLESLPADGLQILPLVKMHAEQTPALLPRKRDLAEEGR